MIYLFLLENEAGRVVFMVIVDDRQDVFEYVVAGSGGGYETCLGQSLSLIFFR